MSLVNVTSVEVGRNPAAVTDGFCFHVVFECLDKLEEDLEWRLVYVGSSEDKSLDQELDCVVMGPIYRGALKFTFEADAPDFSKIPADDILGFTIILLTGSYRQEEFIRIGWYIHNMYADPALQEEPPDVPQLHLMRRIILTDAPRVTRFKVNWDNPLSDMAASSIAAPATDTQQPNGEVNGDAAMSDAATINSGFQFGAGGMPGHTDMTGFAGQQNCPSVNQSVASSSFAQSLYGPAGASKAGSVLPRSDLLPCGGGGTSGMAPETLAAVAAISNDMDMS